MSFLPVRWEQFDIGCGEDEEVMYVKQIKQRFDRSYSLLTIYLNRIQEKSRTTLSFSPSSFQIYKTAVSPPVKQSLSLKTVV